MVGVEDDSEAVRGTQTTPQCFASMRCSLDSKFLLKLSLRENRCNNFILRMSA